MVNLPWWGRRKRVDAKGRKSHQLAKTLSVLQLVFIGVGSTIGAGVYVLVGTVAREKTGPSLVIAFFIACIAAACSAFCYAELASRSPSAGSAYHYSYICLGEGVAWLIGWALILEYAVGGSAVARGITPNLVVLIGGEGHLPLWLSRRAISGTSITVDPCAAVLVVMVTVLLCLGIKESAMVQAIVTVCNVCVLMFVIIVGTVIGFETDWIGYRQADGLFPFGFSGLLGGAATVFFAYIGFDTVASTAEEVKNPQRDLPFGIGIALSICGSLYMLVSTVIVGIVPYTEIDVDTPMSSAFSRYGLQWAMYVVSAGAVAALASTLMGSLLPQPRILMAMARDGLLPYFFLHVNKWSMVPINSTVVSGVIATTLTFFMDVDELSGMVSVGTLLAFAAVSTSILMLRFVPPLDIMIISTSLPEDTEARSPALSGTQQEVIACPLLAGNQEQHPTFGEKESLIEDSQVSKNEIKRRCFATLGISSSCIGAVLLAVGTSADMGVSWLSWLIASVGAIGFLGGSTTLSLLKQDESHHTFGQSGGFLCPLVPWLPLLSILINVYLLANLGLSTWLRVGLWLLLGAVVYALYGVRHSLLSEKSRREAEEHASLS